MTKLEELKAAFDALIYVAVAAHDAAAEEAWNAADDAWEAYHAELNKQKENSND